MKKETVLAYAVAVALLVLLLAGNIAALIYWGQGSWDSRVGFVLSLVGFYGIGMGFIQKSDVLKSLHGAENPNTFDEMSSPNPLRFLRSNFLFMGVLSSLWAVAFGTPQSDNSYKPLRYFGQRLLIFMLPLLLVYCFLHFFVLMPFAYIGYLFSSALVESVVGSKDDILWISSPSGKRSIELQGKTNLSLPGEHKTSIREIVASNSAATKSFLIGILATAFTLIIKGIGIFLK